RDPAAELVHPPGPSAGRDPAPGPHVQFGVRAPRVAGPDRCGRGRLDAVGRAHSWLTLRVAGRIGVAWLVAGSSGPAAASDRWPAWPSAIERIAAPLHDPQPTRQSEQQRVEALERLATYATAAMAR